MLLRTYLILFLLSFLNIGIGQISYLQDEFYNQTVVDRGLLHPVGLTFDANGVGYIWLKRGLVLLMNTEGELIEQPLIDISEEVSGDGDHGLVGFVLDPQFLTNGYFYLYYAVDRHHLMHFGKPEYDANITIEKEATIGRITRYQADVATNFTTTLPNSRKVLVGKDLTESNFPILMTSHGVGSLSFGQDGTLLASFGDAAGFQQRDIGSAEETYYQQALADGIITEKENVGSFKSQMLSSLAGKIIRIDPETGNGIASNPYFDAAQPKAAASRIWAMGLRNPYRFIFKPESGEHDPSLAQPGTFVIGDVGAGSYEEISILEEGGTNFGWPFYEGYKYAWQFWNTKTLNQDAVNPLFTEQRCDREFFYFDELFKEENAQQDYAYINPCDTAFSIADAVTTFVHKRPALAFSNFSWNPPTTALVGVFNAEGRADTQSVETQPSIEAVNFDGYSVIPGFFYDGDIFPEQY